MDSFEHLSILLLEDEYLIALDAEEILRSLGVKHVKIANTLAGASDAAGKGDIDLAILDLNIHGEMSYGVAELFRSNGTPIVFASGYEVRDRISSELEHGDVYLRKPYTSDTLKHAVQTALAVAKQRALAARATEMSGDTVAENAADRTARS